MKNAIILWTKWRANHWVEGGRGQYPNSDFRTRINWESYVRCCPIPALGMYGGEHENIRFDYLIIKGITLSEQGVPWFDYTFLQKSSTPSTRLWQIIPRNNQGLYFTLMNEDMHRIIQTLEENPPVVWSRLLSGDQHDDSTISSLPWQEFVGSYFLHIANSSLSNDEFEDRIARLFIALGFDVVQKGHRIQGEYPDGVALLDSDFAIIYDCKNTSNYYPLAEHMRALKTYYEDERIASDKKRPIFSAFIAKSFDDNIQKDAYLISVESLIYLLYRKLLLGPRFNLNPIRKILVNKIPFTIDTINNEWQD